MLERLWSESSSETADILLLDALSTAAVVRYCRCFTSGVRARLSIDDLPTATSVEIELHMHIKGVRDRHVSHAVNEQEVHGLFVILDGSPHARTGAIGVSSFSSVDLPLQPGDVRPMIELCGKWVQWLKGQLSQEQAKLMPLVSNLSRADLLALPQEEPQTSSNIWSKRSAKPR